MTAERASGGVQTYKRSAEWKHWVGTPSSIGEIVAMALDLVTKASMPRAVAFVATASAPTFETHFTAPAEIQEVLTDEDVVQITSFGIEVAETGEDPDRNRIALMIAQARKTSSETPTAPVVRLDVMGRDRDWVETASRRMHDQVALGARATARIQTVLALSALLAGGAALAVAAAWGDDEKGLNWGEGLALGIGGLALALLLLAVFLEKIAPQLELVPDGATTRWEQLKRRSNISGRWLADALLKAVIGAGIALLAAKAF